MTGATLNDLASGSKPSRIAIQLACFALLLVLPASEASGQTTSGTDGSTPSGLTRGAPAGSYSLSGFEDLNLFNGNVNARLPLLTIGGRGTAGTTMMLPFNLNLEFFGRLLLAYAHAEGDGHSGQLGPHSAGNVFFSPQSTKGIYIHRLPCSSPSSNQV